MEQRSITGQAFRVLTDAANGIFHRISLWTHADDVEMQNGDTLTEAMRDKYNSSINVLEITRMNDLPLNTAGYFSVNDDIGTIRVDSVSLGGSGRWVYPYCSFSWHNQHMIVLVFDMENYTSSGEFNGTPLYVFRYRGSSGWDAHIMSSEVEMHRLQQILERQIEVLDQTKLGYKKDRVNITSTLDDVPMNTAGTLRITQSKTIGYHDDVSNITTYVMPGEYQFVSTESHQQHKSIIMFSNTTQDGSGLLLGGGYICTNAGTVASKWIITRILSPTDFSTDETGLREQIVASLTGQLWPVGAIYINLTRQNPGEFLGGTWNLITEGILTAIKGSPEQAGYHQRDLYKAVKDEDRGQHLYGVFAWQRIA